MIATSDVSTDIQNVMSQSVPGARFDDGALVSWVMSRVVRWRTTRDSNYFDLWDQYWAIWRGQWNAKLKQRDSERSRIISPATQQAVDATVAEMVEATFGRGDWFDIRDDDAQDPKLKQMAETARDNLLSDFERDRVQHAVQETFLNGAIYGTGIAKRIVEEKTAGGFFLDHGGNVVEPGNKVVAITWQAIPPYNFVIDTAALTVEDAQGMAHETIRPIADIEQKQKSGEYFNTPIGSASGYATGIIARGPKGENLEVNILDGTYITEYHGMVPAKFFKEKEGEESPLTPYEIEDISDQKAEPEDYVEAIIIIANGNALLKKTKSPYPGRDRGFIAYQHDRVPNRFWGRGVVEKAYNSQLALDAELRGRIDAMALTVYPMVGFDATRLPRNLNLSVRPGKTFLTNGNPKDIISPINLDNLDPNWFQQSADLERMVNVATGTQDPSYNSPASGPTASGTSMVMGSMLKRAKLTMQTVDTDFLSPLVRKSYLAYQVLDPKRYPHNLSFEVNSSMAILAREFEQTQMTNLLAIIPPQSPAFNVILQAIVENYSGPSRTKLGQAVAQMNQPNPQQQQQQQMQQQMEMAAQKATIDKLNAEVAKLQSEVQLNGAKTQSEGQAGQLKQSQQQLEAMQIQVEMKKMQMESQQMGQQAHHDQMDKTHDLMSLASQHVLGHHKIALEHKKVAADMVKTKATLQAQQQQAELAASQPQGPTSAE